ncbi:MAG: beta-lactamase family protein [Cyclobacteriaceae bacterium]|nr:beta-lactamase family protein [Cyclobacteriaceae bacterium]
MYKLLSKISLILLITTCGSIVLKSQDYNLDLQEDLQKIHKKNRINGFSLGIVSKDQVLFSKGFGFANTQTDMRYTPNTLQNVASVSKTLLGVALLKAQEQGKLHLDDPINEHLPFEINNPYYPLRKITIRHLATHTSTINDTDYYDQKAYVLTNASYLGLPILQERSENFQSPHQHETMDSYLQKLYSIDGDWFGITNFMNAQPGSKYEYSNAGAALAAYVIEQATGISYDQYTQEHILKPLGMEHTGWSFDQVDMNMHCELYADQKNALPKYFTVTYPDGGLLTNLEDLSKFLMELMRAYHGQGSLLTAESYGELFKQQLTAQQLPSQDKDNPLNDEYNSGIFMGFTPNGQIGHTGSDPGVHTYMFFDPQTGFGKIFLSNTSPNEKDGDKPYQAITKAVDKYLKTANSANITEQ